ncbi:MAG: hypothetical protein ACE5FH_07590, partial [Candidatus Zixiibacteriota bacterium]
MNKRTCILSTLMASMICLAGSISAQTPNLISYQGRLTDSTATAIDTVVDIRFTIYDDPVGGSSVWSELHSNITVTNGLFTVLLGSVTPLIQQIYSDTTRYLGISIGGAPDLAPRVPIVSTLFSFRSLVSDTAAIAKAVMPSSVGSLAIADGSVQLIDLAPNGATPGQVIKWNGSAWVVDDDLTGSGNASGWVDDGTRVRLQTSTDSVGIGTAAPKARLDISGNLNASGNASFGTDNLAQGVGVLVVGTSDTAIGEGASVTGGQANSAIGIGAHIGGGFTNKASASIATIAGGANNSATDSGATVSGGAFNRAYGPYSTVSGGGGPTVSDRNEAQGRQCTISGGSGNLASTWGSTVSGGISNMASSNMATIGGGTGNIASETHATVAGGAENEARGTRSTVGGGANNYARGSFSTIAGGGGFFVEDTNSAQGYRSTIGGGSGNVATGDVTTIGGGENNRATDSGAVVGGGANNKASGMFAVVAGGGGSLPFDSNAAAGHGSVISGGAHNWARESFSAVSGGEYNRAMSAFANVSGGRNNLASDTGATIGGGEGNTASGMFSVVAGGGGLIGGYPCSATAPYSVVSGGRGNAADGFVSVVSGGLDNMALQHGDVVGGGQDNSASGSFSTVGGGLKNVASGSYSTVAGGVEDTASGWASSVPGGDQCVASGKWSFASGRRAKAAQPGTFIWADTTNADWSSFYPNEAAFRVEGGFRSEANNVRYGAEFRNNGNGDGMRLFGNVSNGNNWGALYATNTGSSPTIFAQSGTGLAGYFAGDINVTGLVLKSGGGIKIDHPLDPTNKYLYHSQVTSPDMKNVYDGTVVLGPGGQAVVSLPDY